MHHGGGPVPDFHRFPLIACVIVAQCKEKIHKNRHSFAIAFLFAVLYNQIDFKGGGSVRFFKKLFNAFNTRAWSYVIFLLNVLSLSFLNGALGLYSWINELYGAGVVTAFFVIIGALTAIDFSYLVFSAVNGEKKSSQKGAKAFGAIHAGCTAVGIIMFFYTLALVFDLSGTVTLDSFLKGFGALNLLYPALAFGLGLVLVFCESGKKAFHATVSIIIVCSVVLSMSILSTKTKASKDAGFIRPTLSSKNLLEGAEVTFESLTKGETPDASNLLGKGCWTAQSPFYNPAEGVGAKNNAVVEFKLAGLSTFNTAIIEEDGSDVCYFRLQAFTGGEWVTVYRSEKIESLRLLSFDSVTTDRVRLSIDKFKNDKKPVKIKSLALYNEQKRDVKSFEVATYQRLDGDVPSKILEKGKEYAENYARFYDIYSTVIVFAAVHWDENGVMNFGEAGEENFAKEISALKEVISLRSNKDHKVKLIVTALADGAWGNGHNGVNTYMAKHWEKVADQIVEMAKKYDFDGVDIDWEYPASSDDWKVFDKFIGKLNRDLKAYKSDSVISAALSAWSLGLSKETFDCIDQIQFMAYDGHDAEGYQSSLEQAEAGLRDFVKNGADIKKINIGVAIYGRPVNSSAYWAVWRNLENANYWDNKYYNVQDSDQIYDGTFCSPALAGDKTAYALFTGAGGVMTFRIGCDKLPDDPNSVAVGIKNAIDRYFVNW